MTDGVRGGRALRQLGLGVLVADGAGQAGVQRALPVRVGVVQTLLAQRVAVVLAVREHALAHRAHRARLAAPRHRVQEVVVVADADGVVGVGAGRLHAHQAGAERARPALLRVAVVLREGLACRAEEERRWSEQVNSSITSRSVYCTFIREEDTLIHSSSDSCSGTASALSLEAARPIDPEAETVQSVCSAAQTEI